MYLYEYITNVRATNGDTPIIISASFRFPVATATQNFQVGSHEAGKRPTRQICDRGQEKCFIADVCQETRTSHVYPWRHARFFQTFANYAYEACAR